MINYIKITLMCMVLFSCQQPAFAGGRITMPNVTIYLNTGSGVDG